MVVSYLLGKFFQILPSVEPCAKYFIKFNRHQMGSLFCQPIKTFFEMNPQIFEFY